MGRRSDHTRAELEELILTHGHALMAEVGLARFSGREVAKRIGYSIGTVHTVSGGQDRMVLAINARTLTLWAMDLRARLAQAGDDRIAALVGGCFAFARLHPQLWAAVHDHHPEVAMAATDTAPRGMLARIVIEEVARARGSPAGPEVSALGWSILATIHGHCHLALAGGAGALKDEQLEAAALARVREAVASARLAG
ncbi:TetR/AcrR family transcriptional regulator [Sphingomonas sp.]|jgi:AcrR family transcriptional regulator|uniref:TetR/AcrR family transcriptional regulator n=1 Tax=Sphingomonas sp. TaxID=28214 RepID=UPI002D802616|nr:TetR/AcrR family transcriptional regulator [Sphingomonas sp.]HEU0044816.1 TetR/AcrR family transcriptional regulator [Sphingomonas sp.]